MAITPSMLGSIGRNVAALMLRGPWRFTHADLDERRIIGENADGAVYEKGGGQCDICGQQIASVFHFESASGEKVTVGEDCASNILQKSDRALMDRHAAEVTAKRRAAALGRREAVRAGENRERFAAELTDAAIIIERAPEGSFARSFAESFRKRFSSGGPKELPSDKQRETLARLLAETDPANRGAVERAHTGELERLDRWATEPATSFRGRFGTDVALQLRAGSPLRPEQRKLFDKLVLEEDHVPEYLGKVGDKITFDGEVTWIGDPGGEYGGRPVAMKTTGGDLVFWFASSLPNGFERRARVRVTAKVKRHESDRRTGKPQTTIERPKIVVLSDVDEEESAQADHWNTNVGAILRPTSDGLDTLHGDVRGQVIENSKARLRVIDRPYFAGLGAGWVVDVEVEEPSGQTYVERGQKMTRVGLDGLTLLQRGRYRTQADEAEHEEQLQREHEANKAEVGETPAAPPEPFAAFAETPLPAPEPPAPLCSCGKEHPAGTAFYVSVVRKGNGAALLLGPFVTHARALELVDTGNRLAQKADPWTAFDAFGTMSLPPDVAHPEGKLNAMLAEEEAHAASAPPKPTTPKRTRNKPSGDSAPARRLTNASGTLKLTTGEPPPLPLAPEAAPAPPALSLTQRMAKLEDTPKPTRANRDAPRRRGHEPVITPELAAMLPQLRDDAVRDDLLTEEQADLYRTSAKREVDMLREIWNAITNAPEARSDAERIRREEWLDRLEKIARQLGL